MKALNSLNWRYKFFQNRASVKPNRQNMDLLAQMTSQKTVQEEYVKFLEEKLKDEEAK